MKDKKLGVLQPYILDILRALVNQPKRFGELKKYVKTDRTLSLKLSRLQDYGLVKMDHVKVDGKYINRYSITNKGKSILESLKSI
jgi:DNA-binding HxlR family transcriptional regulator